MATSVSLNEHINIFHFQCGDVYGFCYLIDTGFLHFIGFQMYYNVHSFILIDLLGFRFSNLEFDLFNQL